MGNEYESDLLLKRQFDRLVVPSAPPGTWRDVESRARRKRRRRRGAAALATALVVAAAAYGGYAIWESLAPDPTALVITDGTPENLTGVKADLWDEIERVKEQSESGALAWADIQRTWGEMASVYPGAGGADLEPETWVNWLSLVQKGLLADDNAIDVTIYLTDEAGDGVALRAKISAMPEVESATYVSKDDALERLKESFRDHPEVFEGLTGNPLPASLEIRLAEGAEAASFAAQLGGWPGIDQILYDRVDHEGMLALLRTLVPPKSTTTTGAAAEVDYQGLWAGNVQTVPQHPASLPPEFYIGPEEPAELAIGKPLWVFAAELTPEEAAAAVADAGSSQRVLLFDPSEELCELLDIEKGVRPSFMGELPSIFVQRPVLIREKPFEEVAAAWAPAWVDMGAERVSGSTALTYDPAAVYAGAAAVTMLEERSHVLMEENSARAGDSTTDTTDPYPYFKTLQSDKAEELARAAAEQLHALTGLTFQVEQAIEQQAIGAGEKIEHLAHIGSFSLCGLQKKRVDYTVFWSGEDQLEGLPAALGGGPWALFDVGGGSKGIISARWQGYQAIVQLADGVTANVTSAGPLPGELTGMVVPPPVEASPLTPEQLIEFTKWLVAEAEYLHP